MEAGGKDVTIYNLNPSSSRYEARPWKLPHNSIFQQCCLLPSYYEILRVNWLHCICCGSVVILDG